MRNETIDKSNVLQSNVLLKLIDVLGKGIEGLKYRITKGSATLVFGTTGSDGAISPFQTELGIPISIYVKCFAGDEMKKIKTVIPWSETYCAKVMSSKYKVADKLREHEGEPGTYRRRTHCVAVNETLESIAGKYGTSARAFARINNLSLDSPINIGQMLKIPTEDETGGGGGDVRSASSSSDQVILSPPVDKGSSEGEGVRNELPESDPQYESSTRAKPSGSAEEKPVAPIKTEERGENGTPKTVIEFKCDGTACLKVGDKGSLIEEINIRLMGFGSTVLAPKPLDEYTIQTELAVKKFQKDYMGVAETGKVCGRVLLAIDEFKKNYPVILADMKCECGICNGFGKGLTDSSSVHIYKGKNGPYLGKVENLSSKPAIGSDGKPKIADPCYSGTEYPGIHRAIFWAFRAALFYVADKDKDLEYKFLKISSGYRCWNHNARYRGGKQTGDLRKSTNHMGNALDLQFTKGKAKNRCEGADVDNLRKDIFKDRLGAQLGWGDPINKPEDIRISLERAADGATSWVHADVRNFTNQYTKDKYYAVEQAYADGDSMIEIAKREGRLNLINCGGIPPLPKPVEDGRVLAGTLSLSKNGLDFISGWESCDLNPYNDSHNYCTIGYGRLIDGKKSCETLEVEKNKKYDKYKNGVTQAAADAMFKEDMEETVKKVKSGVLVPLFQHEFDALVSLVFNIGGFKKCPNLIKKLNNKDYSGCCEEFSDITNGGEKGLVKRRKAEMKMFANNVYNSNH